MMSSPDEILQEVSAMWRDLLDDLAYDDPTETLLPIEYSPAPGETEERLPPRTVSTRQQRVQTPRPPTVELGDATRHHHDFSRRYRRNRIIGEGGIGSVYLARQHSLAQDVAVKVLLSDDTGEVRKKLPFCAEALVTAYLEHPNTIPVYDAADYCLVMRRVRGDTMEEVIEHNRSRVAIASHVEILIKVCDAIRFAPSRGIIHRDIMARNVMVGDYGEVLVLDLGLACRSRRESTANSMAPDSTVARTSGPARPIACRPRSRGASAQAWACTAICSCSARGSATCSPATCPSIAPARCSR